MGHVRTGHTQQTSVANAEIDAQGHATYHFYLTWVLPTSPHISEVDHAAATPFSMGQCGLE